MITGVTGQKKIKNMAAAAASQSSSRFAGIKKKSIKPELDVDGRVKQVDVLHIDCLLWMSLCCVFVHF